MKSIYVLCTIITLFIIIIAICIIKRKTYIPSPVIQRLKYKLSLIDPYFSTFDIREGSSSFTQNKSTIYICIEDPKTKQIYDDNVLMYVCLHECAHMLTHYDKYDEHHKTFKMVMNDLLKKATILGLYDPRYSVPPTYCGLK